jgi:tetratricopeptide (TPR) repeat protein
MGARAASGFLALCLASCSAGAPPAPPPPPEPKKPSIDAVDPAWAKVLEEALQGLPAADQERAFTSQRHYELALACFNKGDFDKAKEQAQRAVDRWPENLAARRLLQDVLDILSGNPRGQTTVTTPGDLEIRAAKVRVEQAQLEIAMHLVHGRRYLEARMYREALQEFENAELKIATMPYDVKTLNDLLPPVRANITRAKNAIR